MRKLKQLICLVHRDESGQIAVLMLWIGLLLLGVLALVMNMGQYATKRHHVQMAADAAANATEVWRARTVNLVAGSNMVIGENASAEIMFRAVQATYQGVSGRLNNEQQNVINRLKQIDTQRKAELKKPSPNQTLIFEWGLEETALGLVQQTLPLEQNEIADFHTLTESAYNFMQAEDFQPRREEVYEYQTQVLAALQHSVDDQRQAIADAYGCNITLAVTGNTKNQSFSPAEIVAPLKEVQYVNVEPIVHQGVDVPDGLMDAQGNPRTTRINGGDWGRIDDPPLKRFVEDRLGRDSNGQARLLVSLLQAIDNERAGLGQAMQQLLTPPKNATPQLVAVYQQVLGRVLGIGVAGPWWNPTAVNYGWGYQYGIAVATWNGAINGAKHQVLHAMGDDPQYALVTFDRYPVPEWAKGQVYQSAYQNVYNQVYNNNYTNQLIKRYNELEAANRQGAGLSEHTIQDMSRQYAKYVTTIGAGWIADDVANQWILQEWPYEIYPPQSPSPMPPGIRTVDRLSFYTVLAGARTHDRTGTVPVLGKMLGLGDGEQLVAYAQAETFNWMEYNGGYGGSDVYTNWFPPQPWRVSTRGGWNWNPRLAFADGLHEALSVNNPEFEEMMDNGDKGIGVKNYEGPVQVLNQH